MSLSVTIASNSVSIIEASFTYTNQIDQRSTCSFNVLDTTGAAVYQKFQPVVVTDSILGTLFVGIVNQPQISAKLFPTPQTIWTINCVDETYLLDKVVSNKIYNNQYSGTIVADQIQTYGSPEGITAPTALDWNESLSSWQNGVLNSVVATTNASDGNPGDGDLELASAGSTVTFQQQTNADFSAGYVGDGIISPSTGGLTFKPTQAIMLQATESVPGVSTAALKMKIWSGSYTIAFGDVLFFDVWIADSCPQQMATLDLVMSDGTNMSVSLNGNDSNGISAALNNDLSGLATNTWYTRPFFIDSGSAWIGKTVVYAAVCFGGTSQGVYTAYFRNVYIQNGATLKQTIFSTTATATQTTPQPVKNSGYTFITCDVVKTYERHGFAYSPHFDISAAALAGNSFISWDIALPNNKFTYSITASVDHSTTFLPCTNNAAIPGLLPGQNTSGLYVVLVYVFDNAGNDPTLTPVLSLLKGSVSSSYACTKSDIVSTTNSSGGWSAGTLTNLIGSGGPLQLNGFARNWDDGNFGSQTFYGINTFAQGILNKQFYTRLNGGQECRSRLDFAGQWQNFTAEVDVILGAATTQLGFVYRCTGWQNNNDTYAYAAGVSTTQVLLDRGTNSSSGAGSFTSVATATVAFSTNTTYRMKIVVNGSSHQIYIDDVLYVSATDSTYTAAGYIGLRQYNTVSGSNQALFDNFGVMAALSGTWVSPAIDIHSLSTISNSEIIVQIDPANNTSISTILVEISLNNGSSWTTCTNTFAIPVLLGEGYFQCTPVPGLSPGTNVSSMTQVLIRITITSSTAATGNAVPDIQAVTLTVLGPYSSTGTWSSAPLGNDFFIRANQSGWGTSTDGQTYTLQGGGTLNILSNAGTISTTGQTHIQMGTHTATNMSGVVEFSVGNVGTQVGIECRYTNASGTISAYRASCASNNISLDKRVSGSLSGLTTGSFPISINTKYRLRILCNGTTIQCRAWLATNPEPATWNLTVTDSSVASGGFAVSCNPSGTDTATITLVQGVIWPDPQLSLTTVGRAGSSLVNWNALLPTGTSMTVQTSADGGASYQTVSAAGNAITNIALQPATISDGFSTNTSANYTSTDETGGATATYTWDTANSRLKAVGGTNAILLLNTPTTITESSCYVDLSQSDAGGIVTNYTNASNFFYCEIHDASAASNPNTVYMYNVSGGTTFQIGSTTAINFIRGTHHRFRFTNLNGLFVLSMDGVQLTSFNQAPFGGIGTGQVGLWNASGTAFFTQFYAQPQGQNVASMSVYTKVTLNSTLATVTPQLLDLEIFVSSPSVASGVLISNSSYQYTYISANIDDQNKQSNFWWNVNNNKSVTFTGRNAIPAPWPLDSANYQTIGGQQINDILVANRQYVKFCVKYQSLVVPAMLMAS